MTDTTEQNQIEIEQKIKSLIAGFKRVKKENSDLRQELNTARNDLKIAHKENVELSEKFEQFRIAKGFDSNNTAEKAYTKEAIQKLMREIDKCLKLIKN